MRQDTLPLVLVLCLVMFTMATLSTVRSVPTHLCDVAEHRRRNRT